MTHTQTRAILVVAVAVLSTMALAATNVDSTDKWSWGENIGFMNWRDADGGAQGVEVLSDHLRGFIWCENVGWINAGNGGGPYANTDDTDFGINIDVTGDLWGFAWGENIGWINFDTAASLSGFGQQARYDDVAGRFRGYAWGENVGWINLDDASKFVAVEVPCPGDVDGNGVVDVNDLTFIVPLLGMPGPAGDADGNGVVDVNDLTFIVPLLGTICP